MMLELESGPTDSPAPAPPMPTAPKASTDGWLGALERTSRIGNEPHRTLPCVVEDVALIHASRPALVGEHETVTYGQLRSSLRRYARWAQAEGLQPGDTVALLMVNRPEYLAIWLGLTRIGITVALLNTNLVGASLAHCIDVASPQRLIADGECAAAIDAARPHIKSPASVWYLDAGDRQPDIRAAVAAFEDTELEVARAVTLADRALLIYTSGTTGLPKAANVSHHRLMSWSLWFAGLMHTGPDDRMYDCLPLYHSIGGVVAPGSVLVSGGAVVIRRKFSASRFWTDVVEQECTLFQYIGELCRYLVNAPDSSLERSHRLRLCAGNGLRPDVWQAFQQRFAIPRVLEFYAATEGTVSLYNVEGKVGAVGRVPSFMAHRSPAALVRFDVERGEPARDEHGLCQRVARGEVGELIGRLNPDGAASAQRFEGYTSAAESSRKVLRNVFAPGDAWMRTGDLMRQDEKGYFYFVDRVGDTFRWKGENVATTEVAEILSGAPGVAEITVYGVAVPGHEGRAGMAVVSARPDFDLDGFRRWMETRLPAYARPVFLRFSDAVDVTETFKQKKTALSNEGVDPAEVRDPLFFAASDGRYRALDAATFAAIRAGEIRL